MKKGKSRKAYARRNLMKYQARRGRPYNDRRQYDGNDSGDAG